MFEDYFSKDDVVVVEGFNVEDHHHHHRAPPVLFWIFFFSTLLSLLTKKKHNDIFQKHTPDECTWCVFSCVLVKRTKWKSIFIILKKSFSSKTHHYHYRHCEMSFSLHGFFDDANWMTDWLNPNQIHFYTLYSGFFCSIHNRNGLTNDNDRLFTLTVLFLSIFLALCFKRIFSFQGEQVFQWKKNMDKRKKREKSIKRNPIFKQIQFDITKKIN